MVPSLNGEGAIFMLTKRTKGDIILNKRCFNEALNDYCSVL